MSGQPLPLRTEELAERLTCLPAGERLTLTGAVYAVEEAGCRRLLDLTRHGASLPIDLRRAVLCCGMPFEGVGGEPVWELRDEPWVDELIPGLVKCGLRAVIGRGKRSEELSHALICARGVYFGSVGNAAALNGASVKTVRSVIAWEGELERLGLLELPLVVAVDAAGSDLYRRGPERYRKKVSPKYW